MKSWLVWKPCKLGSMFIYMFLHTYNNKIIINRIQGVSDYSYESQHLGDFGMRIFMNLGPA